MPIRLIEWHPDGRVVRLDRESGLLVQPFDATAFRAAEINEAAFLRRWNGPRVRLSRRLTIVLLSAFAVLMLVGRMVPGAVGGASAAGALLAVPAAAGIAYRRQLRLLDPQDRAVTGRVSATHLAMIAAISGLLGVAFLAAYEGAGGPPRALAGVALLAAAVWCGVQALSRRAPAP
jgi:hypothetical protein